MTDTVKTIIGIIVPFIGTTLGAAAVFILRRGINVSIQKAMLGFASGVMMAASVWSLIIPSIEMTDTEKTPAWLPATVGFLAGIAFLLLLDKVIPHINIGSSKPEGSRTRLGRDAMLFLAVTLHNIPEGMAVGVVFAGAMASDSAITLSEAMALSIGIAIQNFPEGAIISMPLSTGVMKKGRAFAYGALSGIVEPIGAAVTVLLTAVITPILPYILSFAAGAMIYVIVEELIPESQIGGGDIGTVGVAIGFAVMMLLDVALG